MKPYQNFQVAAYVYAYYLRDADDAAIQRDIDFYRQYIDLRKVYVENHRGTVDIPVERMRQVKALFEKNGIETSGGITSTQLVDGVRKPSYYDTFCYTDPRHRQEYKRIVSELAQVFDEIILDDFFFTACRCEMCIEAKGDRSWMEYRLGLMEEFSHEIVDLAKEINPKLNFIIKYKGATVDPMKLKNLRVQKNPMGIDGDVVEGRYIYDAFVKDAACDGIYISTT